MTLRKEKSYVLHVGDQPDIFLYKGYSKLFGYHFYFQGSYNSLFLGINRLKTARPQLVK